MYCLKCKKKTDTVELTNVKSRNGKCMKRGRCKICNRVKTQFTGGDLNSIINKLPFELHWPGHNFTGPGTNLEKRLNPDLTPKEWSMPVNRVDKASMHHDICYLKNQDRKTRKEVGDKQILEELNIYNPTLRERFDRAFIKPIITAKYKLGMRMRLFGLML